MIDLMNVDQLKEKLDTKAEIILIDCREKEEWDAGHIEQAQFIPLSNLEEGAKTLTDKSATYVLQCRSGARSMRACQYLQGEGFENLYNLEGGILAWQEKGFPTV